MIRIVTDSAADLTAAELNAPGVFVVPLSVTFADGTTQLDDGTMTKDEFFVRLAEDSKLPRTSQPSPASFIQVYEDAAAAGDEVLVITIGQKLSGTYQCAHLPPPMSACRRISWTPKRLRRLRRCSSVRRCACVMRRA